MKRLLSGLLVILMFLTVAVSTVTEGTRLPVAMGI